MFQCIFYDGSCTYFILTSKIKRLINKACFNPAASGIHYLKPPHAYIAFFIKYEPFVVCLQCYPISVMVDMMSLEIVEQQLGVNY